MLLYIFHKKINKLEDKNEELQEELDEKDELLENARTKIKDLENVCRDLTIQVLNLTPIEEGGEKYIE